MTLLLSHGSGPSTPPHPDVVLVGGVPGAGKTTALGRLARSRDDVAVLDPETLRDRLRELLPDTPYRRYRPLVHTGHALRVAATLLAGPVPGQVLLVHDPATRPRRRTWFARLARARGWTPALVYVDTSHAAARAGQLQRGRVVDRESFDRHWARWAQLRTALSAGESIPDEPDWAAVAVVDRAHAVDVLDELAGPAARHGRAVRPARVS